MIPGFSETCESEPNGKPRLVAKIGCVSVAYLMFVFGFGLLTSLPGNAAVRRTIVEAFNHDAIGVPQAYTTKYGGDAYTDCLVMSMSIFRHRSLWLDAFDTFAFSADEAVHLGPCHRMQFALDRNLNTLFDHVDPKYEYTRYWFGQRYLFQLMATLSSDLQWIRLLYVTTTYVLIAVLALISFSRGLQFGVVMGSISLCLILGFGVDLYGRSVAHAPACIWALIVLCFFAAKPRMMQAFENRLVLAFIAGAVLVYFETLAGSHPFLAGMLVTVNYFGYEREHARSSVGGWKEYFLQTLMLLAFVAAGCFFSLAIRFALALALYDRQVVIDHFMYQARFRVSSQLRGAPVSLSDIASNLWDWRGFFFHGSDHLASVTMTVLGVCSAVSVLATLSLAIIRRARAVLLDLIALLVPAAAMPTWFVLLKSHTVIHAWLMGRWMVVPGSFGLAALALAGLCLIEPRASLRAGGGN